jgi:23S rRNA U2552 (ribose-2'-O)-methylase RlmE/FtsJ
MIITRLEKLQYLIKTSGQREPKIPEKTKKVLREIALIKIKNNKVIIPVRAPLQNHPELYKKIKNKKNSAIIPPADPELLMKHNISPTMSNFKLMPAMHSVHPIAILNITNMLQFADIHYAKLWREQNINIFVKDVHKLLYFPDERTEEQSVDVFKDINGLLLDYQFTEKYDAIFVSMIKHEHKNPNNESETLHALLACIVQLPNMLNIGGDCTMQIGRMWSFLANDILHILAELFHEVVIVPAHYIIRYKNVLCRGYTGAKMQGIPEIMPIIRTKKINRLLKSCALDLRQFREMQYEDSIKLLEMLHLNMTETEAKIAAMQIYQSAGVPVPFLLTKKDMKMEQADAVIIPVSPSVNNESMISPDEFNQRIKDIERKLFLSKRRIDMISDIKKYEKITDMLNVSTKLKKLIPGKHRMSQAFFKMLEILHHVPLIRHKQINVLHLCEAPGQFILAFMQYCSKYGIKYSWLATSLRDGFGDHYGLMAKYPNNWTYGADGTGDITNHKNIAFLAKDKKYDVISSDCGQATASFGMQEEELMEINYCQIVTILLCLRVGGNCVFKTFLPMALPLNISIMSLCYKLFTKIIYFKPSLNPSSSEIYICGLGYLGNVSPAMLLKKRDPMKWMQPTFSKSFIESHFSTLSLLSQKTQDSITRSLILYYSANTDDVITNGINQTKYCERWIKKYYMSLMPT